MKIQKKLILIFSTSIFLFVCIGLLSNYFFMEHYYMYNARIEFVELSKTLQEKIESQSHGVETYVKKYGKKENVRIVILNRDLEVEMTSFYLRKDGSNIPKKKIRKLVKKKGTDAYICEIYEQKKKKSAKMFFLSETENGQYLLFMKNADGVSESAAIANEFYLVIGIGIWLIGSAVTVVFSKKISEPIVRMSEVTAAMARLQFETKIEEKGNDEIRDLAHSINRMSEQLCGSIAALKDDVVLRKQLIRDLSHELKTPVAVIKGYAEGMCYGLAENEQERNQYCEIISRECDRIDQMVRDMLELSWLEQVAIAPRREKINVYSFAEQQLEKYQGRIEEKACSVELNGAVNDMICADQKLFERVFDNLVSNAVKYVNQQGSIEIRFIEKKQDAIFEVYNSGANIPEDQMDKIWNAFYKLDASRKRENGSHGIGLAIVKAILDLHGGSVFVKNEENGVRFGCIFPKTSP